MVEPNTASSALEVLPSLHDNLLVAYEVDCEGRRIKIRARRPQWPNHFDRDRIIVFTGVEAYQFQNDAFGNVISSVEQISVEELISRFGAQIERSYIEAGAPGTRAFDLSTAAVTLGTQQTQGFMLSSSYGLSGWILACGISIERDSPLRSPIISCVLPLLHDWNGGLNVQALVGEVIAADSRMNLWFANLKQERSVQIVEQWFELLDKFDPITDECRAAVQKFVKDGEKSTLLQALSEVGRKLNHRPVLS